MPPSFKAFLALEPTEKMLKALNPAPSQDQLSAFLDLAKNRTFFTTQHAFFCHVIGVIGYGHVTPSKGSQPASDYQGAPDSNALWYPLRYPGRIPEFRRQEWND